MGYSRIIPYFCTRNTFFIMALSKNRIKYIHSLELKKNRDADQVFVAEGPKLVNELLGRFPCLLLAGTSEWAARNPHPACDEFVEVSDEELGRASFLKHPQQVLAVFRQKREEHAPDAARHSLCLALDGVQDPGNLGTIIRLADWFGIRHLFCSPDTADLYNPKVVQATMGSLARVSVHYTSLPELIGRFMGEVPVYGTFLDGENIYAQPLSDNGLIVMGNEGRGIRKETERLVTRKLYIPAYPKEQGPSESLNVAIATAIVCAEFRRQAAWP